MPPLGGNLEENYLNGGGVLYLQSDLDQHLVNITNRSFNCQRRIVIKMGSNMVVNEDRIYGAEEKR